MSSLTYVLNVLGQGKLFSISGSEEICALCVDRLRDLYAGLRIDSGQRSCLAEKNWFFDYPLIHILKFLDRCSWVLRATSTAVHSR